LSISDDIGQSRIHFLLLLSLSVPAFLSSLFPSYFIAPTLFSLSFLFFRFSRLPFPLSLISFSSSPCFPHFSPYHTEKAKTLKTLRKSKSKKSRENPISKREPIPQSPSFKKKNW
jgi:hypothetical protein